MKSGQSWFMVKREGRRSFNSCDVNRLAIMTLQCGMKFDCEDCQDKTISRLLMKILKRQVLSIGMMRKAISSYQKMILSTSAIARFAEKENDNVDYQE